MMAARTRKMTAAGEAPDPERVFAQHRAAIVLVSGAQAGCDYATGEYVLEWDGVTLGRGPGVDIAIDDACMSRKHAILEISRQGFRIRDLGSTNSIVVNGSQVQVWDLKHGDRFELGEHTFEYVQENREE
jgi:predicted component of type VI protein secretion system